MGQELGAGAAGYNRNFAYGTLQFNSGYFRLVDDADNAPGEAPEALYVDTLVVPFGATLDLNGQTVFARTMQIDGTLAGGLVGAIADGGPVAINSLTSGAISVVEQVDEWTFFGRSGGAVAIFLNPGELNAPPPPAAPPLRFAHVELLDPAGNVTASGESAASGSVVSLLGEELPADGTYRVRVKAPVAHADSFGHYLLSIGTATVDTAPLVANQRLMGALESPHSADRWTFAAAADVPVRFRLLNSTSSNVRFRLNGPDGWTGFNDLNSDSELMTLPADGNYLLEAYTGGFDIGQYAFVLDQLDATVLEPGVTFNGELALSGQAQLFQVDIGNTEVYLRYGAPPTRRTFDYRSETTGADQFVQAPFALPGAWYVLVYGDTVVTPGAFALRAANAPLIVSGLSPEAYSINQLADVTVSGSGFVPGMHVELIAADGTEYDIASVSVDAFDRLTATLDLHGVPEGAYDVRVTQPGVVSDVLQGAFTVLPQGEAKLETHLILPGWFGRHVTATIYVEYANTGNVAMPAPILTLQSADPDNSDLPVLTLDQSMLFHNYWSEVLPPGTGNSVQIYASGKTAGLLLPGEKVSVPVYYAGLQQPYDFGDSSVELELRIHDAGSEALVNWPSMKEELQPFWMEDDAWNAVFDNLVAQIGPTWGDYVRMISQNASYLERLGQSVLDVTDLFQFELQQAIGLSPVNTLAQATDTSIPTSGLPLSFGRTFGNSILDWNREGVFGAGWTAPWQYSLEELVYRQSQDEFEPVQVTIRDASGGLRIFQADSRSPGKFFSQPGDTGELHRVRLRDPGLFPDLDFDDRFWFQYEVRESNGNVMHFDGEDFGIESPSSMTLTDGKLLRVEDEGGSLIAFNYSGGNLTRITHSSGATLEHLYLAYNAAGRIASLTDSLGRVTTYGYDASNQHLLTVMSPAGVTTYTYSPGIGGNHEHALTSITDPSGVGRFFSYDAQGRLASTSRSGNAEHVDYVYDAAGRVTATDAAGVATSTFFDQHGLAARIEDSVGSYTRLEYNNDRQLIRETDSLGRSRAYVWCGCGGLESLTDELGRTTRFKLDKTNNRATSFTDARGNVTQYAYDGATGNLTSTTYPDGSVERIAYDATGNATSLVNRRGQPVHFSYNTRGQVTNENYPDGSSVTYTYDAHARLATATDAHGVTTFTYDSADRLARVDYPNGRWLDYAYDAAGRRTRMRDHTGFIVRYSYDAAGRLTFLRDVANANIVEYKYDAAGRLQRENKGNGTYSLYEYDGAGRVESIVHHAPNASINSRFDYTYDALGRRTGMDTIDGDWTYDYDLTGQLTRAVFDSTNPAIADQDLNYEYDEVGNRVRTVLNGETTAYVSNNLNQYSQVGAKTLRYDRDGNLVEETGPEGTRRYTYNAQNQLVEFVTPEGTWRYEYDALGNRTATTVNGVRTEYLLDPTGMVDVIGEYGAGGARIASYAHGLGLEAMHGGAAWQYYDFDALGSTAGLVSFTGNYSNRYAYLPFGEHLFAIEGIPNGAEFVGEWGVTNDDGLQLMRARVYNPKYGRFMSIDPIRLAGGDPNLYRYVTNLPTVVVDPLGLQGMSILPPGPGPGFCEATHNLLDEYGGIFEGYQDPENGGYQSLPERTRKAVWEVLKHRPLPTEQGAWEMEQLQRRIDPEKWKDSPCRVPPPDGPVLKPPRNPPSRDSKQGDAETAASTDPNEKFAAAGFGPRHFIDEDTAIPYHIDFENLGPGSVPAPVMRNAFRQTFARRR